MEQIYDINYFLELGKGYASNCLYQYDSYVFTISPIISEDSTEYQLVSYCGNKENKSNGDIIFNGYKVRRVTYKNNNLTTNKIQDMSTYELNISNLNSSNILYSNIYELTTSDILGHEIQPTKDEEEVFTLPFDREEFIAIPFLLCVLIIMLFLKWCFPMKGGKSL